jgi:hypothetical protein
MTVMVKECDEFGCRMFVDEVLGIERAMPRILFVVDQGTVRVIGT